MIQYSWQVVSACTYLAERRGGVGAEAGRGLVAREERDRGRGLGLVVGELRPGPHRVDEVDVEGGLCAQGFAGLVEYRDITATKTVNGLLEVTYREKSVLGLSVGAPDSTKYFPLDGIRVLKLIHHHEPMTLVKREAEIVFLPKQPQALDLKPVKIQHFALFVCHVQGLGASEE